MSLRRQRLQAVADGLSTLTRLIVLLGAAIAGGMTFLLYTDKVGIEALLTSQRRRSAVLGLNIFLIFALDGPLVGDDAVQLKIFQEVMSTMNP